MVDTSKIKADILTSRGQFNLLILHFTMCTGKPVFQQYADINFLDVKTRVYYNYLNAQVNFWCYGVVKTS